MAKEQNPAPAYISNPFVLAHQASVRLWAKNRGWAILLIVLGILNSISSTDNSGLQNSGSAHTSQASQDISVALVVFTASFVLLFVIVALVFVTYVAGILSHVTLESEKGKKVTFSEAYRATKDRFWRLFGALLLAAVKIFGWTLLFIVPGIIAAVRYSLLSYVIIDEKAEETSVKAAHDRVKLITKGRLWEVFGMSCTGIIPFIGTLYSTAGSAGLYKQLKEYTEQDLEKPKIHWLNYFVPIMCVLLIAAAAVAFIAWTALRS